ncbi:MAG: YciI family protein [Geminicoccaceae bacterium]
MQYMIAIYETEAEFARRESEEAPAYWGAWTHYAAALRDAGILVGGEGLQPPHAATTVRVRDGRRMVQDGPYADTKERLGGFFVIEVPDLDSALDWAERCPGAATGAVEVRPTLGRMPT